MTTLTYDPFDSIILDIFKYTLPVNLFLSAFILLQNTIILVDYFPDRKKLVISLFMLIAILDMTVALGTVLEAIPAIICFRNSTAEIQTNLWYFPIAGTGYIVSVLANAVLSVTKTISIRDPFARVNRGAIYLILMGVSGFWITLAAVGFNTVTTLKNPYIIPFLWNTSTLCPAQWRKMNFSASEFMSFAFPLLWESNAWVNLAVEIVAFLLPCIAALVCMFIQTVYIRRYLSSTSEEFDESRDSHRTESREAHHVNVTVFSVSILFVICTFFHSPLISLLLAYVVGFGNSFLSLTVFLTSLTVFLKFYISLDYYSLINYQLMTTNSLTV